MSTIRKLKRDKSIHNIKKKAPTKLSSLRDTLLIVGIFMVIVGTFYGVYNYNIYTSGSEEHTTQSRGGPVFQSEEAPGNLSRRASAMNSFTIAGIGILLIVLSVMLPEIDSPQEIITNAHQSLRHKNKEIPKPYRNRRKGD